MELNISSMQFLALLWAAQNLRLNTKHPQITDEQNLNHEVHRTPQVIEKKNKKNRPFQKLRMEIKQRANQSKLVLQDRQV